MSSPKKHHFVPRFLLKEWANDNNKLWLYLKNNLNESPKLMSVSEVGQEKNLYTSTGGDKSIETDYLGKIDYKASIIHKNIITSKVFDISEIDKSNFTHFVANLFIRNPRWVNKMKNYNEKNRESGLKSAEDFFKKTGIDSREIFLKKQYDDTPKLIKIYSTIGEQTAMSKVYENDFKKINSSKWIIYENKTDLRLILGDFPALLKSFSSYPKDKVELPDRYSIFLPLSPKKLLVISNDNIFIKNLRLSHQRDFIRSVNINIIKNANNQIYSKDNHLNKFILNHI